jgi:DNA-binding NarL/FixJ family response regulator
MNQSHRPYRVLIVDDTQSYRELAHILLSSVSWIEIVGHACTGKEAVAVVREVMPDLVLMDITMPEMSGLDATRQIKADNNAPRIIIWTNNHEPPYANAAWTAGADGFVLKTQVVPALISLVQTLAAQNYQ